MDPQQQDQQKDFVPAYFPIDGDGQRSAVNALDGLHMPVAMYNSNSMPLPPQQPHQQLPSPQQVNMEILNLMASMQAMDPHGSSPLQSASSSSSSASSSMNPQLLLEQQFKFNQLRQLQQLQQQIFQQQLAIISSSQNSMLPETQLDRSSNFHGLPTPTSSSELRPQQSSEFVSPMSLHAHYVDMPQDQGPYRTQGLENQIMNGPADTPRIDTSRSHRYSPRGSASAPAHVAFRSSPEFQSLPSPSDLDFDISPLASPWLGANQQGGIITQSHQQPRIPSHPQQPHASSSSSSSNCTSQKRTASPSSADHLARKKQSPAIRPTNPAISATKRNHNTSRGGSRSVNSTPLLRSTRARKGSTAGEPVGDTPSPVDLSMPPPASTTHVNASASVPPSPSISAQLTPVTPASIMKLGRLGVDSSLAPKSVTQVPSASRLQKKASSGVHASPGLKAILPAGSTSSSAMSVLPQPVMQVRKTSHKAAEQKRRDSLKTTFDELRGLLPPIPLPNEEKYLDEPLLPGALPPRGPPKAGNDGPNKGVSKLQLLICGNDYIRQLKGRVDRRDCEIEKLRTEVKRLRLHLHDKGIPEVDGGEELDLERDLDAIERIAGRSKSLPTDDEARDLDGDEDMVEDA